MLPRRIVALGVCFALLLTLALASVASARETLIHTGNSGSQNAFSLFAAASGTTLVRTTDPETGYNGFIPVGPNAMARFGCVMLPLNSSGIDSFRIAALKTYAEAGGTVVLVGEYAGIPSYNSGLPVAVMNAVASGMGSTMQLESTTVDFGASFTTTLGADPLMAGVASIGYDATSTVNLGAGDGAALARASANQPFMGVDQLGAGRVVLIGDSNVVVDLPDQYTPYGNDNFVRNLCGDLSPPDINIDNPVPNARYKVGQPNVKAFFQCTDEDDRVNPFYSDILYCIGSFANNTLIDTSVAGNKTFTVDASDLALPGNLATKSVNYVVDGTAPIITITTPADGATYVRRDSYPAGFTCVNDDGDPTPPTITFATTPLGLPINTNDTGNKTFTVTCVDAVGNSATVTHDYIVVDQSPPEITITTPAVNARYRLNQSVTALFGCTDEDGPADIAACIGPVANGGLVPTGAPGLTDFTVNASDVANNTATKTHQYFVDASPPAITITVPANGAKYNKGSQIIADYACADDDGPQDIASCNGPVADGNVVDSSAAGSRTFKVDASDLAGNTATKTHTYTILGTSPPSVTIASPVDGATFKQGAAIPLSYSCADPDGPADIKSCTRVGGSGTIDSSKAGTFEVTARVEDFADNVRTKTHKYTVVAPDSPKGAAAPNKTAAAKVCKSRRSFKIRVKKKKGVRIVSATVTVNGKKVKTKKGKRVTSTVTLTGLKKGRYTVIIKAKLSDGRTVTDRRRFKTCTPKGK